MSSPKEPKEPKKNLYWRIITPIFLGFILINLTIIIYMRESHVPINATKLEQIDLERIEKLNKKIDKLNSTKNAETLNKHNVEYLEQERKSIQERLEMEKSLKKERINKLNDKIDEIDKNLLSNSIPDDLFIQIKKTRELVEQERNTLLGL